MQALLPNLGRGLKPNSKRITSESALAAADGNQLQTSAVPVPARDFILAHSFEPAAGKATCDQCRVKKRKHCAVQVASVYSALNSTRPLGCPRGELQSLTLERSQPTYTFPPCYSNLSSLPDAAALQFTH